MENNYVDRVVNIPGNTFEDTSIATCIVVLKKNRTTTDIIFEDGERIETVPYSTVEGNDYNLLVNIYLPDIIEREEIDPSVLENEARRLFLEGLRRELDIEKMVCEMEGIGIQPLINSIRAVLREYDTKQIAKKKDENQLSLFDLGAQKLELLESEG